MAGGYKNVLRQLLPNAAGTFIVKNWQVGDTASVQQQMVIRPNLFADLSQLAVIVFVQDAATREVYQTAFALPVVTPTVITATEPDVAVGEVYSISQSGK